MSDDSPKERQDNEIEALKAIFGKDLEDLRKPQSSETWKPLDILLKLFPQQGSSGNHEIHCMINLKIECPHSYPDVEPVLSVRNSKGLSDSQLKTLLDELRRLTKGLRGEVMIFEIAQHVQTFLHGYNKPGFKSFYEEMLSRQKQNEQIKLRDKQVQEDKERQEIQDEILRRQEILRAEKKLVKEPRHSLCQELVNENSNNAPLYVINPIIERTRTYSARRRCQSTSESSDGSICEHRGTKVLKFSFRGDRQIYRGRCLGHSERGCVVYSGLDITSGELLAMSEWSIKFHSGPVPCPTSKKEYSPTHIASVQPFDLSACTKQIASIEQEMSFLMKLHHPNLVHYVNIKYVNDDDTFVVYLLQEFILGGNISCLYLNDRISIEVDTLRHFASGLLDAVDFLHRNNVVHKDLRETSVFVDRTGTVRLADYSLDKRLMELSQGGNQGGKYSKKQDILRIGILLISLLRGAVVTEAEPKIPTGLSQDLKDFLNRCLDTNERTRWSTDQLLNHQFIKTPLEKISPQRSVDQNDRSGSDDGHGDSPEAMDIQLFIPTGASSQSRIKNEFEILKWLGKGAFGDVLKVKNKLDGGSYAIKRIELNPKNKQLNKKITREVKLLSRLNHENVVRYYNSWIESATIEPKDNQNSSNSASTYVHSHEKQNIPINQRVHLPIDKNEDIEKFAPPAHMVEWSVSYSSRSKQQLQAPEDESSSGVDSSESEDDMWPNFLPEIKSLSSSDSIEFKRDDSTDEQGGGDSVSTDQGASKNGGGPFESKSNGHDFAQIQYLYIQMEFCEKSTLRNAIDNELNLDSERMWRLFREIVEGLSHIHQQGMIHRDLKPVNIFLDSNDHVKIGDFGLATNILPRATQSVMDIRSPQEFDSYSQDIGDGSLTGHVGTALYVAPELTLTGNKAIYNQKVDIYSLGIILFEMSYIPLNTGMERVKTLGNLRTKEIIMPEEFMTPENSKQIHLIKWLLNYDVSSRPTCAELLQWDQLPGALEEYELREVLRHALLDTHSKAYRYLVTACLQQEFRPAEAITYDLNQLKNSGMFHKRPLLLMTLVKETIVKIFKLHGGVELAPPLLLPHCHLYEPVESSVRLMTHSGGVVHIPYDLRAPFARYIVWNSINMLKRYSVERVYREKKIFGFHPRELYECSFDIVTPTPGSLFAEAELLSIVCEITNAFPAMKSRNLMIRLNHTSLLKAVLLSCGIKPEKYNDIYTILSESRDGKLSKFQVQTHLISLCLSDQAMVTLFSLMETECPVDKLGHILKAIIKRKGEISALAKEGLRDLELIVSNAEALGVKYPILISPCMVYNVHQFSGMMCQFVCELKKKRRKGALDVIAAGGRYDGMLANLRKTVQHAGLGGRNDVTSQAAAGISLSLETLAQGVFGCNDDEGALSLIPSDVCVCATSSTKQATNEKAQIVNMLWSAGIRSSLIEATNIDEIQDVSRDMAATHIIMVKESEQGTLKVRSWDKDRFQERKVNTNEIVEFMQRLVKTWNEDSDSGVSSMNSSTQIMKSDSRILTNDFERQTSTAMPVISVNFITPEKLAANARRRLETQIITQISSTLEKLSPKTQVEVFAISMDIGVLRSLATYLEMDAQKDTHDLAVRAIIDRHPRHKKYIMQVCDEFRDLCLDKKKPVVILYSLQDFKFKMIL